MVRFSERTVFSSMKKDHEPTAHRMAVLTGRTFAVVAIAVKLIMILSIFLNYIIHSCVRRCSESRESCELCFSCLVYRKEGGHLPDGSAGTMVPFQGTPSARLS